MRIKARAIFFSTAAATLLALSGVASVSAFASSPPGDGGGSSANCKPYNDSVTFSGTSVIFEVDTTCNVIGTLYLEAGKGTNFTQTATKTCTANVACVEKFTWKNRPPGQYCLTSQMDIPSGPVYSDGHVCESN